MRHLAIARCFYWFDVDKPCETACVLAVFFGGQDRVSRVMTRCLEE